MVVVVGFNYMKTKKNRTDNRFVPKAIVALDYNQIYGEEELNLTIADHLADVPTLVVLHHILMLHWPLHYVMNSPMFHRKAIGRLNQALKGKAKRNLIQLLRPELRRKLQKNKPDYILIDTQSTLHVCYEALRNYMPMEGYDDNDINATEEELQDIYKAYLKANSYWTGKQCISSDIIDTMLAIEVPFIEFKHPKPVLSSAYKALKFFEYCESHPPYDAYLKQMLTDIGLDDWHQYISLIVSIIPDIIKSPYVKFDEKDQWAYNFFAQYAVDIEDFKKQKEWDGNESIKYLRDNFVIRISPNMLMFLSPDLIVDKLYQALKFTMWKTISNHNLLTPSGKPYNDFSHFTSQLGTDFSEKYLANAILTKIFANQADALYNDEQVKQAKITSPSDFYILKGENLAVVEYKDLIISDSVKHSGDINLIKKTIIERICLDTEILDKKGKVKRKQKGVGQILDSISRLMGNEYDKLDSRLKNVKKIFPIVVTTDITFSALGINLLIIKETECLIRRYADILKDKEIFIFTPIIIDLNNLIDYAFLFNTGKADFFQSLEDYIRINDGNLQSFDVYVKDRLLPIRNSKEEVQFLIQPNL